jgi:hypothetical protein
MSNPVPVKIENMGKEVNSRYEEYSPSITADGSHLYFTSRRSNTTGEQIDRKGDFKFYEDIYQSTRDSKGDWSEAEKVEGSVNTETHDGILSILNGVIYAAGGTGSHHEGNAQGGAGAGSGNYGQGGNSSGNTGFSGLPGAILVRSYG